MQVGGLFHVFASIYTMLRSNHASYIHAFVMSSITIVFDLNNNNKFNSFIALFTIIDQKRFTELTIDTIFTLLISYIVMKLLNINILKIQYPYLIKSQ